MKTKGREKDRWYYTNKDNKQFFKFRNDNGSGLQSKKKKKNIFLIHHRYIIQLKKLKKTSTEFLKNVNLKSSIKHI